MIRVYEKSFGPYAFPKDGFSIIEAPYGMDHQGAVCIGAINNPVNSDKWDSVDIRNMIFHESAHEWWGNNVTCKDMADFWIHESFASYAEVLAYENIIGQQAATKYLLDPKPFNKEPIIGYYDVNDFHMGDMYPKGARILHTLRSILDNDTAFFGLLNGIQRTFRYQSVTTEDIVGYINQYTGRNFTPFFDQYLRHAAIPQLQWQCTTAGDSLTVKYKWKTDVSPFDMPVKISLTKDRMGFIYPSTEWKTVTLPAMTANDCKIDADNFYITVDR
jgi:aminopeptidase N